MVDEYQKTQIDKEVFEVLKAQEGKSVQSRVGEMKRAVDLLEKREEELQSRYYHLKNEKERLLKTCLS